MIGPYKLLLGLVLGAALFFAGWYSRTPVTKIQTVVQAVTKTEIKEVEKVVVKVVKQVVTQPDGTVTKTETSETTADTTTTTVTKKKEKSKSVSATPVQVRRDYSLGLQWQPDWKDPTWRPTGAVVGYRAFADAWVTGGYDWGRKSLIVGVAWQF